MSEERNKNEDLNKLREELKDLIDHRISYNNGFTNLLRGDYSLFISLIFLILSVVGVQRLEFLPRYYVLSVYSVLVIWWFYGIYGIKGIKSDLKKKEQEGANKPIIINHKEIEAIFSVFRPTYFSLSTMFFLCIVVLWYIRDFRWWLWTPTIILGLLFLCLAWKKALFKTIMLIFLELLHIQVKDEILLKKFSNLSILITAVAFVFSFPILLYYIAKEFYFIILQNLYSILGVILIMFLILISLASLSEYLSMKFMVTEVSNQNHKLSMLRMGIDRIEDAEALEKKKKELHEWYVPKADSFLLFFNYYYLMFTKYTFEVGEEEKQPSAT